MTQFPCVVRIENHQIHFDVPCIEVVTDKGFSVTLIDGDVNKEDSLLVYEVKSIVGGFFFPTSEQTLEVTSWENVHPSDWSPELIELSDSFV